MRRLIKPHQGAEGRSCKRKERLAEEFDAKKLAKKRAMRAYECAYCGGWHLTKRGLYEQR